MIMRTNNVSNCFVIFVSKGAMIDWVVETSFFRKGSETRRFSSSVPRQVSGRLKPLDLHSQQRILKTIDQCHKAMLGWWRWWRLVLALYGRNNHENQKKHMEMGQTHF